MFDKKLNKTLSKTQPTFNDFVVCKENAGFKVVKGISRMRDNYASGNGTIHEVIISHMPRNLAFDIDLSIDIERGSTDEAILSVIHDKLLLHIYNTEKNKNKLNILHELPIRDQIAYLSEYLEYLFYKQLSRSIKKYYKTFDKWSDIDDDYIKEYVKQPFITSSHGFVLTPNKNSDNELIADRKNYNIKYKFSLHFVFRFITANFIENKELALAVINEVPKYLQQFIDKGIYKKNSMLRLVGNSKPILFPNQPRMKLPITRNRFFELDWELNQCYSNHLVTNTIFEASIVWCTSILKPLVKFDKYGSFKIKSEKINKLINRNQNSNQLSFKLSTINSLNLTPEEIEAIHQNTENKVILGSRLKRLAPGKCKICNKTHENDNGYIHKSSFGLFIGCFRSSDYNPKNKLYKVIDYQYNQDYVTNDILILIFVVRLKLF